MICTQKYTLSHPTFNDFLCENSTKMCICFLQGGVLAAMAARHFFKKSPSNILKKNDSIQTRELTGSIKTARRNDNIISGKRQQHEIIEMTKALIDAHHTDDYAYETLCDPHGTALGMDNFQEFTCGNILDQEIYATLLNPYVHLLGDNAAYIAYIRLTKSICHQGHAHTFQTEETRVWHKRGGKWKNIHFHGGVPRELNS